MGLDDADLLEDGDGDGDNGGKASTVSCSICLESVTRNGDRSWAILQCGHEFHLDCIGSAFNIKGVMQCPNCRKVEKGQWLFANGCRSFTEFNMDDLANDDDLYDLGYSEMSVGVHWCPFSGLTRLPSSFDEREFSSAAYHDLLGHAMFAEHAAVSSATHPCPYIAYFGPIHPSSSNSAGNVSDGSNFNAHWNGPSLTSEMPSYAFPAMDVRYQSWEHHSSPFPTSSTRIGAPDQPSILTQRAARANTDIPRSGSFMHPFLVGHSSAAGGGRAGSSVAPSLVPSYPGSVARTRDRVQALQAYFHPPSNAARSRSSSSNRGGLSHHVGLPFASSSDQQQNSSGFNFFPSGRNFQEAEHAAVANRVPIWGDHLPQFQVNQVDRDPVWGTFNQAVAVAVADTTTISGTRPSGSSSSFRQRHGSERLPSQNRS